MDRLKVCRMIAGGVAVVCFVSFVLVYFGDKSAGERAAVRFGLLLSTALALVAAYVSEGVQEEKANLENRVEQLEKQLEWMKRELRERK